MRVNDASDVDYDDGIFSDSDAEPLVESTRYRSRARSRYRSVKSWWQGPSCICCFRITRWKAGVLGSAVVLLLLALIIILGIFVIAPKLVQDLVDDSELSFHSVILSEPKTSSIMMTAQASLSTSALLGFIKPSATVGSSKLSISYDGQHLGHVTLPELDITIGEDSPLNIAHEMYIDNISVFNQFGSDALTKKQISWKLSASPSVKSLGLSFDEVSLVKTTTIPGLGGLTKVTLEVFNLADSNSTDVNVFIQEDVYNPSFLNLQPLGNLTFTILYKDVTMGVAHSLKTVNLNAGDNIIQMASALKPDNLTIAAELMSRYLSGRDSEVLAKFPEQNATSVPIWNPVLSGFELKTVLKGNVSNLIGDMVINSLEMYPINNTHVGIRNFNITVGIANPLGKNSPIDIHRVSLFTNFLGSVNNRSVLLGHVIVPPITITNGDKPIINIFVPSAYLAFPPATKLGSAWSNFEAFIQEFTTSPSVSVTLNGTTNALSGTVLGEIELSGILVNTSTSFAGINGWKEVEIVSFSLPADEPNPPGGVQIELNTTIFNPSIASLSNIGDVTFQTVYNGFVLGEVVAKDFLLRPGLRAVSLNGFVHPQPDGLGAVGELFSRYLTGKPSPVNVKGKSVTSDVAWLQEMIASLSLSSTLQGNPNPPITSVQLGILGMDFESSAVPLLNTTMTISLDIPFGFKYSITSFRGNITMRYGLPMGEVRVPWTPSSSDQAKKQIYVQLVRVPVEITDAQQFGLFIEDLFVNPSAVFHLLGNSDALTSSSVGIVTLSNIGFTTAVTATGINNFKDSPLAISEAIVNHGSPGTLELVLKMSINNTTPNNLIVGPLGVNLWFQGVWIGHAILPNFNLFQGMNYYDGTTYMIQNPSNYQAVYDVISLYAQGLEVDVVLTGRANSTKHTVLQPALSKMLVKASIPAQERKLLKYAELYFSISQFLKGYLPVDITVENPFGISLNITAVHMDVYTNSTSNKPVRIGIVSQPCSIYAKPHAVVVTQGLQVAIVGWTVEEIKSLFGDILLYVNGTMNAVMGDGFTTGLSYAQGGIPASFLPPPNKEQQ